MQSASLGQGLADPEAGEGQMTSKPSPELEALCRRLNYYRTPAIGLLPVARNPSSDPASGSYFGGTPKLPQNVAWPLFEGRPLHFLASVECQEIPDEYFQHPQAQSLPRRGTLLFFYNASDQPWGSQPEDAGQFSVLYSPESVSNLPKTPVPSGVREEDEDYFTVGTIPLRLEFQELLPTSEKQFPRALGYVPEEVLDEYWERLDVNTPRHQLCGTPCPVQNDDMEEKCQLVSNKLIRGESPGHSDPSWKELRKGAADWILLAQFDSDDNLDVMWGDAGRLYFWIRKQDLDALDFSKVWCILQCY